MVLPEDVPVPGQTVVAVVTEENLVLQLSLLTVGQCAVSAGHTVYIHLYLYQINRDCEEERISGISRILRRRSRRLIKK